MSLAHVYIWSKNPIKINGTQISCFGVSNEGIEFNYATLPLYLQSESRKEN